MISVATAVGWYLLGLLTPILFFIILVIIAYGID